jgi:hypothetical protein
MTKPAEFSFSFAAHLILWSIEHKSFTRSQESTNPSVPETWWFWLKCAKTVIVEVAIGSARDMDTAAPRDVDDVSI